LLFQLYALTEAVVGLCGTLNAEVRDETSLGGDLLCKPTDSCSFLYGQQRFTQSATEPGVV
jgi:hypothetical protein